MLIKMTYTITGDIMIHCIGQASPAIVPIDNLAAKK